MAERLTVAQIQAAVCQEFDVPVEMVMSSRRWRYIIPARQTAMYLVRNITGKSFPTIGRHFGNRDHSTVIHGCSQIARQMLEDPAFALRVTALEARLQSLELVEHY